jgi:integrase
VLSPQPSPTKTRTGSRATWRSACTLPGDPLTPAKIRHALDAETVQVLRDHWKRQAQDRLKAGPEWKGTDDYVFRTAWGEPIHPDTVSSLMTTLIKAHNDKHPDSALPHARLHDLRHVHATTLLLAGTQVHVVARLGHADPSITLRVYAHVISNQLAEAASIFAQVMKAAG